MPEGMKFDGGKPRAALVLGGFADALMEVSKVGTFGAWKYEPNNWKLVDKERYEDALFRHLLQWQGGEFTDSESGLPHLAHAAWNVLAILQLIYNQRNSEPVPAPMETPKQLNLGLGVSEDTKYTYGSKMEG